MEDVTESDGSGHLGPDLPDPELTRKMEKLSARLTELKETTTLIYTNQGTLSSKLTDSTTLQNDLSELRSHHDQLQDDLRKLQQDHRKLQTAHRRLQEEHSELHKDVAELKKYLETFQAELGDLKKAQKTEIANVRTDCQTALKTLRDDTVKEMASMKEEMTRLSHDGGPLHVVLFGITKVGKSSLGNALLGKTPPQTDISQPRDQRPPRAHEDATGGFQVGRGFSSKTLLWDWDTAERFGTTLEVVDTPGLHNNNLREENILKEMARSMTVAERGINVIIFVLRCDCPFTKDEYQAFTKIKALLSEEMNKYVILVFNGLDGYDEDEETIDVQRAALARDIQQPVSMLKEVLDQAGGRYIGMNNKASPDTVERQVQDLIQMMQDLVRKNGRNVYYKSAKAKQIVRRMEGTA